MADKPAQPQPQMSREELVGYHKGSVNTLIAERAELLRIVQITESLLQAHLQELKKLGINLQPQEETKAKKSA